MKEEGVTKWLCGVEGSLRCGGFLLGNTLGEAAFLAGDDSRTVTVDWPGVGWCLSIFYICSLQLPHCKLHD